MRPQDHCWEAALDGDLGPDVSAHLASCPSCAELVERVQSAAVTLEAEIPAPPPGLDVSVLASIEAERQAAVFSGRPPWPLAQRRPPVQLGFSPRLLALAVVIVALVIAAVAVVSPPWSTNSANAQLVPITPLSADCTGGGRLVVAGVWGGSEATEFAKVLRRFEEQTGIQVRYAYQTRDIATKLEALVKSGCVPNVALLPQPGTMADLARRGALKPIGGVAGNLVAQNYSQSWRALGTVDGKLYGVWFKAADKSLIWYRPSAFTSARIARPPRTWNQLLSDAARLRAAGIQPFAIAGHDGWTLTDWFENVYLATAGLRRYQQLAENRIKWTDPSVKTALAQLAKVFGDPSLIGATAQALSTTFEQSVSDVFGTHPRAAMVFEGDYVRSFLPAGYRPSQARFFTFPTQAPSVSAPIEVGGDVAVLLSNSAAGKRLLRFLATPAAGEVWAHGAGFISPNHNVPLSDYPDAISRQLAARVADAPNVSFGISDQEPPAFGSDPDQGMWAIFQQFLAHPHNIDGITRELQAGASAAAACERAVGGDC
jgi:ABC-type glycerol-3-phosphate transport system substrate-binding protein